MQPDAGACCSLSLPFGAFGQLEVITVVHAPKVPTLEMFKEHSAHTMDGNDPDLEAFESNLCAIFPAR